MNEHLRQLDSRLAEIAERNERTDETHAERSAIADDLHDIQDELHICYGDPNACGPTTTTSVRADEPAAVPASNAKTNSRAERRRLKAMLRRKLNRGMS